jgi:hypothetical protein
MTSRHQRRQFLGGMSALVGTSLGLGGCGGGDASEPAPDGASTGAPSDASRAQAPRAVAALASAPPPGATLLESQAMDLAQMIVFDGWHEGSRYERYQRLTVLSGSSATIKFHGENLAGGGALRPLLATQYTLLVDAQPKATATITSGAVRGSFTLGLADLAQGWHLFEVVGGTVETCPRWFMYVDKGQARTDNVVPVASGSYDVAHRGLSHFYGRLQLGGHATAWPLAARECPSFSEALPYAQLFRENLVPSREGNITRCNRTTSGVVNTFNKQAYFFSDLIRKQPQLPLLDGPRNVGTLMMPTTILVTRQGGAYFADPWRVGRVAPDGTITTRAGYRHRDMASYWQGPQEMELVGDWSAIPAERRGFHEIWGLAWDGASLATNPDAKPIDGEKPHLTGPRLFVADSQNNRVILLSFKPDAHDPPVVTEFLTGLQDPWDVAWAGGVLFVTERQAHRIAAYDAHTGAFLRTVVSGAALARIDVNREVLRLADLATIRAQPCVAPEGLFHQDGWLYFGAKANGQVRRVKLDGSELQVVCEPLIDGNSKFIKITLSDGTFGPRGTVFSWTWSIGNFGMPMAHLPNGTRWSYNAGEYISRGRGGRWETLGYGSAGGIGLGRLICGSSQEGLVQISKALPTDPAPNYNTIRAGQMAFQQRGLNLLHGHHGYGHHGLPLPWGQSPEIDHYLRWNGLSPVGPASPAAEPSDKPVPHS